MVSASNFANVNNNGNANNNRASNSWVGVRPISRSTNEGKSCRCNIRKGEVIFAGTLNTYLDAVGYDRYGYSRGFLWSISIYLMQIFC